LLLQFRLAIGGPLVGDLPVKAALLVGTRCAFLSVNGLVLTALLLRYN